jgi:hypothetical protein
MGFGMVILSAAIKGVSIRDIASKPRHSMVRLLAGVLFRNVTFPLVKGTSVVVLATGVVGAARSLDIVRTMTGGNFSTNVACKRKCTPRPSSRLDQGKWLSFGRHSLLVSDTNPHLQHPIIAKGACPQLVRKSQSTIQVARSFSTRLQPLLFGQSQSFGPFQPLIVL